MDVFTALAGEGPALRLPESDGFFVLRTTPDSAVPLLVALTERADRLLLKAPAERRGELGTKMRMIFSELVCNVYQHAHREDADRKIYVRLSEYGGRLSFEVADEGGDFYDPRNAADSRNDFRFKTTEEAATLIEQMMDRRAEANHDPSRPDGSGGRGILLAEKFSSGVQYAAHVQNGKTVGTRVTVHWNFKDPLTFTCAKKMGSWGVWLKRRLRWFF